MTDREYLLSLGTTVNRRHDEAGREATAAFRAHWHDDECAQCNAWRGRTANLCDTGRPLQRRHAILANLIGYQGYQLAPLLDRADWI